MLFCEFRSMVEKIREETSNRIAVQSQSIAKGLGHCLPPADFNATLIQIRKDVANAFQQVIDNTNCLERDLWETVGKKAAEETPTQVSSWNHRD